MSEENTKQENGSETESASETVSIPELETFIFDPDEFREEIVPRKLSAPDVAKFLLQKINKDTKLEAFIQVEKVADFYDTTEIVEKYKQFLDKKESGSEEVRRSIVIDRIIAFLGNPADVQFAKEYYKYLIEKVDSIQDFQQIILLHETLGLGGDSGALKQKIQSKLASLEAKKDSSYQARLEYLKFQETIPQKLTSAEDVQPIKDKVLRNNERRQRLEEEIKMYVTNEYRYPEYLQKWSARRIRRETWAAQLAEQIKRNDEPLLKEDVVKSLRAFLDKLGELSALQKDAKEAAKVRLLRAVLFFNGKVSSDEREFLNSYKRKQVDILANEGFLLE